MYQPFNRLGIANGDPGIGKRFDEKTYFFQRFYLVITRNPSENKKTTRPGRPRPTPRPIPSGERGEIKIKTETGEQHFNFFYILSILYKFDNLLPFCTVKFYTPNFQNLL